MMKIILRLDPNFFWASTKWCEVRHPKGFYVCSRLKGHAGLHLAQYGDGDGNAGEICQIEPNPWGSE
jgi:hypothetical protein